MNILKPKKVWWAILLMFTSLFISAFAPVISADSSIIYTYSDSSYSSITGPGPGLASDTTLTYKKVSDTEYDASQSVQLGTGRASSCTPDIKVSKPGATSGTLLCNGESQGSISISIPSSTDESGVWLDQSHIQVGTDNYVDTHISNGNYQGQDGMCYVAEDGSGNPASSSCPPTAPGTGDSCNQQNDYIDGFPHDEQDTANATATVQIHLFSLSTAPGNNSCVEQTANLKLSDPNNAYEDYFIWQDAGTITTSDGTSLVFKQSGSDPNTFDDDLSVSTADQGNGNNTTCTSQITVTSIGASSGTLILRNNRSDNSSYNQLSLGSDGTWPSNINNAKFTADGPNCWQSNAITIPLGEVQQSTQPAGTWGGSTNDVNSTPSLSCSVTFNPLTWLLCPAVQGMVSIVNALDNVITDQLDVGNSSSCSAQDSPCTIFGSTNQGSAGGYYTAWNSFRNIALGLIVVAVLIVVISQALGFEFLDAYTIRRALPRVVAAAIFITLSWTLMKFLVTLTNDLGFGVRYLIYKPFVNLGSATLNGGGNVASNLVGSVAIVALGIFGLLTFAATAALAVFVAFLVLILRQLLIIVLVIVSPLAIVAYILPNTQNLFKIWWDSFSRALLMFPLIMAFIAAGRVFAVVAGANAAATGGLGSTLGDMMGFAAYFLPYFLLPATFKFAGGALRQIGGFVNDRHKGGFDRLRNYRGTRAKQRTERARAGTLWREDFGRFKNPFTGKQTSIGRLGNRAALNLTDQDELVPYRLGKAGVPGFRRGRYVAESQILDKKMEHNMNAFQALQKAGGIHYSTARAMQGNLDYFTKDASANTTQALLEKFGEKDENGNFTGQYRAPQGTMDLIEMANILGKDDNSKAQLASQELTADAGTMGSLRDTDMHRADLQTLGLYAAAAQGRTEMSDLTGFYNSRSQTNPNEAARVVGVAQDLSKAQRPSQRRGHGVAFRRTSDNKTQAYSVYDQPNSNEARASVMSIHPNELASAKAEDLRALSNSIVATASRTRWDFNDRGEFVNTGVAKDAAGLADAEAMRSKLLQVSGRYGYTDAGGSVVARRIEDAIGVTDQERNAMAGYDPNNTGGQPPQTPTATPETPQS